MLKVRKITHRPTHTVTLDTGEEVEVQFEPIDWLDMHAERVGDKLVVAYMVHDSDPSNPMTEFDGQGTIYTKATRYGGGVITDNDSEVYSNLCVDGHGFVDRDLKCTVDGIYATLAEHAANEFMKMNNGYDLAIEWCDETGYEHDVEDEDLAVKVYDGIWDDLESGEFKQEEIDKIVLRLFMKNWREIVGPYVVPIHHCSNNHGPGTTTFGVTSWDGDPDDLPDGVWVAGESEQENIDHNPLPRNVIVKYSSREKCWRVMHNVPGGVNQKFDDNKAAFEFAHTLGPGDIAWQSERYAEGILEEYEEWCNGNVYGCVVETFEKTGDEDDDWEMVEEESCWGFIGGDHAEEALLSEFFKPTVEAARKST